MKKNTLTTVSILTNLSLFALLKLRSPKIKKQKTNTTIYEIKNINNRKKTFKLRLKNFKYEIPELKNSANEINQSIKMAEFKIRPRIKRIKEKIENL